MNYNKLKLLYKKELMDICRDKKTIFTMVLLPLILYPLIFLVVMQLITIITQKEQERTYYIAYDQVTDHVQEDLNVWMDGEDGYDYNIKVVDSKNPKKDLKDEDIDAYISMKENGEQLIFNIHYLSAVPNSNSVAQMLKDEIDSFAKKEAEDYVKQAGLDVNTILYPITSDLKDVSSKESSLGSILGGFVPFFLLTSVLMGAIYPAIDATTGEKERGTLETLFTLPISNMELIISKFLSVATISVFSVLINVLSMIGIVAYLFAMLSHMNSGMDQINFSTYIPAILISVLTVIVSALFISAVVMCVCAFAKSFKEANNYITPVMLVVMFTGYLGFIPNVELDIYTALIPIANICLLIKSLLIFEYDFLLIMTVLLSNIIYAFIAMWVLAKIYSSEMVLFGESFSGVKLFERRKNIKKGSLPSIQESLFVLVLILLFMVYVGGVVSISNVWLGVILPQVFIFACPFLACFYIKGNIKEIFVLHIPKLKHVIGAICLLIGTQSFVYTLSYFLSNVFKEESNQLDLQFGTILEGVPFVLALLMIALLPAVCEEFFFRGYLMTAFKNKISLPKAIFIVSFLFGITHMSIIKLIPTMMLGVALAYGMQKSNSLFVSILMHFLNNAFAVYLLYYGKNIKFINIEKLEVSSIMMLLGITLAFVPIGMKILNTKKQK